MRCGCLGKKNPHLQNCLARLNSLRVRSSASSIFHRPANGPSLTHLLFLAFLLLRDLWFFCEIGENDVRAEIVRMRRNLH